MKTIRKMLLTMLLATPVVTAGELVWIEEDGTTVEPASLLNEAVRESHLGFPDDDNGPGTLMIWRNSDGNGGGPDLQAPLVTDRPDFTEASSTVGRGVVQLEAGYTFMMDKEGTEKVHEHSGGEPLIRWGMGADWLELRFALLPTTRSTDDGSGWRTVGGTEDLYLGAKLGLTPQDCHFPEMAIILQSTVPTGSNEFTSDETLPGFNLIYAWEVNDKISLAGSTQANRRLDDGTNQAYVEVAQSVAVGLGLSDHIGLYTEWFTLMPNGADTAEVEHYFNGGFTLLLSNDVQFDIRAGHGLNQASDDFFAGIGLSVRFR
ncbi:MAG: hypothetical protein CM1200mP2_28540 [Planctomycetaceae bacterium]|nr:MAG: hypothetical protein CM1200mP2_28540 [Planctomycetaceae bacterium]